jgi:translation initiation factor IF-1
MPQHGVKKAGSKKAQAAQKPMGRSAMRALTKNKVRCEAALENPDECTYARIVKPLGFGKFEVMHEKGKTGLATLCGVLRSHRGSPCVTGDMVTVERLDGSTTAYKRCYLISAILSPKQTAQLKASGALRDGVFKGMSEEAVGGGAGQYDCFDWSDLPELQEEEEVAVFKGKGKIGPEPLSYEEYMAALLAPETPETPTTPPVAPKPFAELTEADIESI